MAPNKKIHLNFFDVSCAGNHMGIGLWKAPGDNSRTKNTVEYYTWLAKLAEKGKITTIFFADVYGTEETYGGNSDASFYAGATVAAMDPVVWVSAMAAVTKSVGFGITGSTSYLTPYILARTWATLDHATKGRIGWNVVTSYGSAAAKAMGKESATPHDQRYDEAHEYMELIYSLLEGSWEPGAQLWDPAIGAYDASKIHKITFKGQYHNASGIQQSMPGPQRTPVLFQAGSSSAGKNFGAKHAEALFIGGRTPAGVAPFVKEMRAAAVKHGRAASELKFFPQITPILGRTLEEAQAKYEGFKKLADWRGGLVKLSSFLGVDLSQFPVDEPFDFAASGGNSQIHTMFETIKSVTKNLGEGSVTPRRLGEEFAFCGFANMPVGTPEMVADVMEEWANVADIDGFNVAYVSNPGSYEDIVELLVPALQERGLMWKDYAVPGGTLRENLHERPGMPYMPEEHTAAKYQYEKLKGWAEIDGHGDVTIDKRPKESKGANGVEEAIVGLKDATVGEKMDEMKTELAKVQA
ncbi:dimethyl-sulfide monooxygenase-1 [Coleophoma crateriformis]|uniref:Dimethyl-sulfide monooxygenase-1 n=1 Tax=Coleophoma crateriformis TaxID=565419 RepID=A0A3D8QI16_9HELO|nr:dimethyl-sulfide monooxygenase-1 [Coleophoma crateriformis]